MCILKKKKKKKKKKSLHRPIRLFRPSLSISMSTLLHHKYAQKNELRQDIKRSSELFTTILKIREITMFLGNTGDSNITNRVSQKVLSLLFHRLPVWPDSDTRVVALNIQKGSTPLHCDIPIHTENASLPFQGVSVYLDLMLAADFKRICA